MSDNPPPSEESQDAGGSSRLQRALDLGENALGATIGAAAGLSPVPSVALGGAALGVAAAALLRGQLSQLLSELRIGRVDHFLGELMVEADMTAEQVVAVCEKQPEVTQLVEDGIVAAARSAAEEKRRLLARVLAAALSAEDDTCLDEHRVLLGTVAALEPYHVRFLVTLATPRAGEGSLGTTRLTGAFTPDELGQGFPMPDDLAGPMLAALEREHLVEDVGMGSYAYSPAWRPTEYAHRLMTFLPGDGTFGLGDLQRSEVVVVYNDHSVIVRNLGPGPATVVAAEAICDQESILGSIIVEPIRLGPGKDHVFGAREPTNNAGVHLSVQWIDGRDEERTWSQTVWIDDKGQVRRYSGKQ